MNIALKTDEAKLYYNLLITLDLLILEYHDCVGRFAKNASICYWYNAEFECQLPLRVNQQIKFHKNKYILKFFVNFPSVVSHKVPK